MSDEQPHIYWKQGFETLCEQISLHKFKKWSWFNFIIIYWDNIKVFSTDICISRRTDFEGNYGYKK